MHRIDVHLRINRNRPNIKLSASTDDADRDFAAVGYQDFLEHWLDGVRLDGKPSPTAVLKWPDFEQRLTKLDRFSVIDKNLSDNSTRLSFDFIHHFHRFDDADDGVGVHLGPHLHIITRFRRRGSVESSDHRGLDFHFSGAGGRWQDTGGCGNCRPWWHRAGGHIARSRSVFGCGYRDSALKPDFELLPLQFEL